MKVSYQLLNDRLNQKFSAEKAVEYHLPNDGPTLMRCVQHMGDLYMFKVDDFWYLTRMSIEQLKFTPDIAVTETDGHMWYEGLTEYGHKITLISEWQEWG